MQTLFYREIGSGPPLVFLHGFCETHEIWNDFISPLAAHFRIITVDLPGFGESEILRSPFTIDEVGDKLVSFLKEKEIQASLVVGHSLGGYVALSLAERYPEILKGFCLFHSTAFADSVEKRENRDKVMEFVKKNGVQPFVDTFVPGLFFDKSNTAIPEVHRIASQTKQATLIGYSKAMRDRPDRSGVLCKNEIPKLVLAGVEDTLVPIQISQEMGQISQNCSYYELRNTAHMGLFEAKMESQMAIKGFAYQLFLNN